MSTKKKYDIDVEAVAKKFADPEFQKQMKKDFKEIEKRNEELLKSTIPDYTRMHIPFDI